MRFPGFIGPSYTASSKAADGEELINYVQTVGDGGAHPKNSVFLERVPGRKRYCTLPDFPLRALQAGDNRLFAVSGKTFYEIFNNGLFNAIGTVQQATTPADIVQNGNQIFLVSGTQGYITDGVTINPVIPAVRGAFMDSYFIAQQPNSNQFNLSAIMDGNVWDPLDFGVKEGGPDRLFSLIAFSQRLYLLGEFTSEPWWDSGGAAGVGGAGVALPFQRADGGLLEIGIGAPWSLAKFPDSLMFLSLSPNGGRSVWRLYGGQFVRVSNHAMEAQLANLTPAPGMPDSYPIAYDAVGYTMLENGHWQYHLDFPSANNGQGISWVYDATTSEKIGAPQWHKRLRWDTKYGIWRSDKARFHAYTWDQHFVGGGDGTGKVYLQSPDYNDDDGDPIRRVRSSPHINDEANFMFYDWFQLDMSVGNAPAGVSPTVVLQISRDGGFTWGNEKFLSAGQLGQYTTRVRARRLGRARDACFRTIITDPINECLVDAYLGARQEFGRGQPGDN